MLAPEASNKFLRFFYELIQDMEDSDEQALEAVLPLGEKKIRVPEPKVPLQIHLGGEDGCTLELSPEIVVTADGQFVHNGQYLLFDPARFFSSVSGFLRLRRGASLTLGRKNAAQQQLLDYPDGVADKHLRLKLNEKGLSFKNRAPSRGVSIAPLTDRQSIERMARWRQDKLRALADLLQAPIEEPPRAAALDLLEQVIAIMRCEPHRLAGRDDRPGSVLRLPSQAIPIIVGDLHACIDNLLVVLTQNDFLDALTQGRAVLILLGDAAHPDEPGREAEMETSMWLMDLIFRLKVQFPDRVFYLRGNHDSFAEDIAKGGVPQGLVWEQALHDQRGKRYRDAMHRLYNRLPYIAYSADYICCHAGAPTMKYSRADLINARRKPKLQLQLTRLRPRHSNKPDGYGASDVRRLRKHLDVAAQTPFIVGHTPRSADEAVWSDAGGIKQHFVLFGANPNKVGVLTRSGAEMLPLTYPVEPLMAVYNRLVRTGRFEAAMGDSDDNYLPETAPDHQEEP
ncbi:metallophosphoesterase [Thiorhodovibrio frisius]|uniref:Calcineurin-like phosphoesterase n=1 Tax=Thiorhodovibrio frisius TaxID=631362 RepID=H8YYN4_9GAMM|nr:metallophosphoesterase [Thiorhodovibrio frisius]EIC23560.1 Calcineurin-like phosphoesterase [Thiorhodovibrio frisius]WPL23352.1 Calcineurin-like phosphoesterase [Thiorhodovibrio frisius]